MPGERTTYGCHRCAGGQNLPPPWAGTALGEALGPAEATYWVQWGGAHLGIMPAGWVD